MRKKSLWNKFLLLMVASLLFHGCSGSPGGDSLNTVTGDQNSPGTAPILSMPIATPVGTSSHDNQVTFTTGQNNITFSMTGYDITSGQPWHGISTSPQQGFLTIDVICGRKGSSGPLDWMKNWVSSNNANIVYADYSNPYYPGSMNFALTGVLTVGWKNYDICLGQYGTMGHNIWLCSEAGSTASSFNGHPAILTHDNAYYILGTGNDYQFVLIDSNISQAQGFQ
jgi:hypothetical protein